MQRRIQRPDRNRQTVHCLEDPGEIIALQGQKLLQRSPAILFVVCQNHRAHVRNFFLAEEHVLGAAQSDTFRSECSRLNGVARNIGIGAHFHRAIRIGPLHELLQLRIIRIGINCAQLAFDHASGRAVERNPVALFEYLALHSHLACLLVDVDVARARHAALAHAARDHGGVAGHTATGGQNAFRDFHAVNVFRRGFGAHQDHRGLAVLLNRFFTAASAVKTICPTAAPGDAGNPVASTSTFVLFSSRRGTRKS